jgi:hypothetical protein
LIINESYYKKIEDEVKTKLFNLDKEQVFRLDEAVSDYHNEGYLSTVAMAVSAVELRTIDIC